MEHLIDIHTNLQAHNRGNIQRELANEIDWNHRLICIKGFRGVGKTTFLLDIVRNQYPNDRSCLYVNLNNFYFTRRKLYNFADEFYKKGGKTLILDQINKYQDWARELRACYDSFPELKIIFSASPVLRVIDGNEFLKDIARVYHLEGLSFREYLNFTTGSDFCRYSLSDLLKNHQQIATDIIAQVKPLAFFNDYLKEGYYPYFLNNKPFYNETLLKHINLALEIDVTYLNQIELKYLPRLRKLLQNIASQVPFSPNVSKLSTDIKTSRATVMNYLAYLKNARLINQLFSNGNDDQMKKPDQVYLHNTNLIFAIDPENNAHSNLRLTFFYNQVGYQHVVKNSSIADFKVNDNWHFTVGGKYTEPKTDNCFAAADLIEIGEGNIIPLWLFGFLY